MPNKQLDNRSRAPPSSSKRKSPVEDEFEDEHMEEVEDSGEDNNSSDENYEESPGGNEDDDAEDAPDESQFIGLDVSRIRSEQYTILRHIDQFQFPRSATLNLFHTKFQQDVYQVIYGKKQFANHRFVKWNYLGQNPTYNGLYRLFRNVGLESLVSLSCNFHSNAIKQFYATVFVSPDHDRLTWMTGHQQIKATRENFMQAIGLKESRGIRIHLQEPLALTLVDEYYDQNTHHSCGKVTGLLPLPSIVNRIMRVSFFPRSGNNDEIHGRAWNVIKYIMEGTRFDVMDLIIREIAISKGDKSKSIYYAPYIMKLIKSMIIFDTPCDIKHKEYRPRDAPPPPAPKMPAQVPPPPPQSQGHGSSSQGPQEQDPILTAILHLQLSVDQLHAFQDETRAMMNTRFDALDASVSELREQFFASQQQQDPLIYHRFGQGQRPPSFTQRGDRPSSEAPPADH